MVLEEGGKRMLITRGAEFCTSPVEWGLGVRCDLISGKSSLMTGIYFICMPLEPTMHTHGTSSCFLLFVQLNN